MPTSTSTIFRRVTRRRPCRICGKPDWCSYTRDERISICMRFSKGARKINRQNGAIFVHEEGPIDVREVVEVAQSPIAPIDCRDFVYARLIQLSTAELFIVATPCVTANHGGLIHLTRRRRALIAFDQDSYSNEAVCFHLASLIARRMRSERTLATTRIASWDRRFKGIDDAAVRKIPISSISVRSWFDRLSPHFQQIAMTRFAEFGVSPYKIKNRSGSQGQ